MNWFDQLILLATGLVAIYLIFRFIQDYNRKKKPVHIIFYIISFAVLLVAGLLLILKGYSILPNPEVIVVTTLIPLGIANGLVKEHYPKTATGYLVFSIVGFLAILLTRFMGAGRVLQILALAFFHSVFGLTIFIIPILQVRAKNRVGGYICVTIGGALIGLGGIALAFLKSGSQLLFFSQEFVMTILAPLLLLMALSFTWGFVKQIAADKK